MKKTIYIGKMAWVGILIFSSTATLFAQDKKIIPKGILFGTSFTYIRDTEEGASTEVVHREMTWNINVAVHLSSHFRVGLTTIQVFDKNLREDWKSYYLAGPMLQYDFFPDDRGSFMVETGLMYGNFAPVFNGLTPIKNAYFIDFGASFEYYLAKGFYFELGAYYFPLLNKIEDKDNFVRYVIGINYFIGERKYNK